jgi:hypothetical protein
MIEFKGELTGKAKKFLLKEQVKVQAIASSLSASIFSVPLILAAIYWDITMLFMLIPLAFFVVVSFLPADKKAQKEFVPKRVFVDLKDEVIVSQCENTERFHMIDTVKRLEDYGEWYYVVFQYSDRDMCFVCQKSLLTQGSLEEFEGLFEGKIERRVG